MSIVPMSSKSLPPFSSSTSSSCSKTTSSIRTKSLASPSNSHHNYRVTGFSQSNGGVWYYDVEVEGSKGPLSRYIVRRRYNDFWKLYCGLQKLSFNTNLPPFPQKRGLWSSFIGNDLSILTDRKQMFQQILTWIEHHPIARCSKYFINFIGSPPSSSQASGYISLHEYSSPNWFFSFSEMSRHLKETRARRNTAVVSCSSSSQHTFHPLRRATHQSSFHQLLQDMHCHTNPQEESLQTTQGTSLAYTKPSIQRDSQHIRATMCV